MVVIASPYLTSFVRRDFRLQFSFISDVLSYLESLCAWDIEYVWRKVSVRVLKTLLDTIYLILIFTLLFCFHSFKFPVFHSVQYFSSSSNPPFSSSVTLYIDVCVYMYKYTHVHTSCYLFAAEFFFLICSTIFSLTFSPLSVIHLI